MEHTAVCLQTHFDFCRGSMSFGEIDFVSAFSFLTLVDRTFYLSVTYY